MKYEKMPKIGKAKVKRASKSLRRTSTNNRIQQIGITEKVGRLFYSWVKKRTKPRGLIHNKYALKQVIGQGTFGLVYLAENIHTSVAVAVKLEYADCPRPQLKYEAKIYEKLGSIPEGFIEIYYFGPYGRQFYALCMELLGPDLDDLYCACNNHFSLKTVLMIAIRVIKLIEHIHSKNIIYRDVKPENFCIGHHYQQKEKTIFIVDFGLSKMHDGKPVKLYDEDYNYLIGTARYMSINALRGATQTKRDDLEAIGYMLVYFLYGKLPWMGLSHNRSEGSDSQFMRILKMKQELTPIELCPDVPAIATLLEYARAMEFEEDPNYDHLTKLMEKEMRKHKFENDGIYDWTEIMGKSYLTGALDIDPDN